MKEDWDFQKCVWVLTGEIEILKKISDAQRIVRQAVINKEWADFDEKTAEVNRLGEEFALLEEQRIRLFAALSDAVARDRDRDTEQPFYALITRLPAEESRELSLLYQELKMETMKMRSVNESLLAYIHEAKAMAEAYLEAVCPERGGKLYTRKGRRVSQDLKSMVFNNHF
jgi:hypothetical protein